MASKTNYLSCKILTLASCLGLCTILVYSGPRDEIIPKSQIRVQTNLITVDVLVKDKKGNAVEDLKQEDFKIFEDGKEQQIVTFGQEHFNPAYLKSLTSKKGDNREGELVARTGKPSRKIVLLFDVYNSEFEGMARAREAAAKFINSNLTVSDEVAIMVFDGSLKVLVNFTSDHQKLLSASSLLEKSLSRVDNPTQKSVQLIREIKFCKDSIPPGPGAAEIRLQCAKTTAQQYISREEFRTRQTIFALQALIESLGLLEGRKSVILLSSGFSLNPANLSVTAVDYIFGFGSARDLAFTSPLFKDLIPITGVANKYNVTFYTIDIRGLIASPTLTAEFSLPPNPSGSLGLDNALTHDPQDSLNALAVDTGGKAFFNSNGIYEGLLRAIGDRESYYVVGYAPSNATLDGTYRKINVKINRSGLEMRARKGYWARPTTEFAVQGEILLDRLEVGQDSVRVPVKLGIRKQDLHFKKRKGKLSTQIAVLGRVYDRDQNLISSFIDSISPEYTEQEFTGSMGGDVTYEGWIFVPPYQAYKILWTVKEIETGNYGTLERTIELDAKKLAGKRKVVTVPISAKEAAKVEQINTAAKKALAAGDVEGAIKGFREVTKYVPNLADAHYNLGLAYQKKGLVEQAIKAWEKAVELDPGYVLAHLNLALAYLKQNNASATLKGLNEAVNHAPDNPEILELIAGTFSRAGERRRAIEIYERMIKLEPRNPRGYVAIAPLYVDEGELQKAIDTYGKYIEMRGPRFVEAYRALGELYRATGAIEKAREHFLKYIDAGGEHAEETKQILKAL